MGRAGRRREWQADGGRYLKNERSIFNAKIKR